MDIIFNTTATNLDLKRGAVSRSILQAAGDIIQREVSDAKPNGLRVGEYVTSSGGNLKCKKIVHVVLRTWDGEKGRALEVINDLFFKKWTSLFVIKLDILLMPAKCGAR